MYILFFPIKVIKPYYKSISILFTCCAVNIFIRERNNVARSAVLAGIAVIGMMKLIWEEMTIAILGK